MLKVVTVVMVYFGYRSIRLCMF